MRIFLLFILCPCFLFAQESPSHSAAIKLKLRKLNVLASVLYVAAHPDDENTRIITSMANDRLAETAYLSMTRGDGGQNLIGPEMRSRLGLIRTQELLAARRIDGGQQFFTRAVDFGYSKSADETFSIWRKDEILHDVVKVFRAFQPDVIITRFPPDERAGHGHHTASAMLAIEAFDKAANKQAFPEQLKHFNTWQTKRLYTNTGRWWNTSITEDTPGVIVIDVGAYSPLLGQSFSEIAAVSRSQHKSQGFGSRGTRGRQLEFLEHQLGEKAQKDLFEGINTTWSRIKGSEKVQQLVTKAIAQFDVEKPAASIPLLTELRTAISKLEPSVWRDRKLVEVEEIIRDCAGLYLEITTDQYWVAPGEKVRLNFELVNRSQGNLAVEKISIPGTDFDTTTNIALRNDIPVVFQATKTIQRDAGFSDPYWLKEPHDVGLFNVKDFNDIGKPENDPSLTALVNVSVGSGTITFKQPVLYKWTDPVKGELSRPFEIVPPVFINLSEKVMIFRDVSAQRLRLVIKSASRSALSGKLSLKLPEGWRSEPESIDVSLAKTGEEQVHTFRVIPSASEVTTTIKAQLTIGDKSYDKSIEVISYDHIPIQTLLPSAEARVVRVDLRSEGGTVGYIKGAGDDIPAALQNMGYRVVELSNDQVTSNNLRGLDAVVLGIRALNTNERIRYFMPQLLEFVNNGGTLIVQYNTSFDMGTDQYAPFPLQISRDRVAEEDAAVTLLKPDHQVLNFPNKITPADFDGWVQERGLYFPGKWDPAYEAIFSMNDKGETPKEGSLLIAKYGKGHYVYTGLSFFRQLPEGIAGAYKLFDNLVSLGKAPSEKAAEPLDDKKEKKKKR